jgi:hypothetical protein
MPDISRPISSSKPLDFKAFEDIAKNTSIKGKSTIHIATQAGGRIATGLTAKSPFAGKIISLLGKPISNLEKASPGQRSGILATQAFKQALIQKYGQAIANAVDKHLIQSGQPKILTAQELRKNLKVAAAIARILRSKQATEQTKTSGRNHTLSNSSNRRNDDGSPLDPSAPPRSRSSSLNSENSADVFFQNQEKPPAYRSTEDLRPSAPPQSPISNPKQGHEADQTGNQWHHNPLYIPPVGEVKSKTELDRVIQELEGQSPVTPQDKLEANTAQAPKGEVKSQAELDQFFKELEGQLPVAPEDEKTPKA